MEMGTSVLLVEPVDGAGLASMLRRCAFDVTSTQTPEEALFEFGQRDVDVVVAALPLPGMGTTALCHELRRRGRTPVLLASLGNGATWLSALEAGADDHVSVPCDERELAARLRALVRRYRGWLTPLRVVRIGRLAVRRRGDELTIDPDVPLTPVQSTIVEVLSAHLNAIVSTTALDDRLRAKHGDVAAGRLEVEIDELRSALAAASGQAEALQKIDDSGWRLTLSEL